MRFDVARDAQFFSLRYQSNRQPDGFHHGRVMAADLDIDALCAAFEVLLDACAKLRRTARRNVADGAKRVLAREPSMLGVQDETESIKPRLLDGDNLSFQRPFAFGARMIPERPEVCDDSQARRRSGSFHFLP
jgi:hypothetical protein